jgi:hypothetical protein
MSYKAGVQGRTYVNWVVIEKWYLLGCYAVWLFTRRNNPEDTILHSHRRENLKSG